LDKTFFLPNEQFAGYHLIQHHQYSQLSIFDESS